MAESEAGGIEHSRAELLERNSNRSGWIEVAGSLLVAFVVVLTAWAAFQAAKWNGVQAENSRQAAGAGTAASRATTVASAQRNIDLGVFLQWLQAFRDDLDAGLIDATAPGYVPDLRTLSGFIAARLRPEFKPAFDDWIASRPLVNSSAAATPFQLPSYRLAVDAEAERLVASAEASAREALEANHRAENYILTTVLFAIALVFASISGRLKHFPANAIMFGSAAITVLVAAVVLATYPVEI